MTSGASAFLFAKNLAQPAQPKLAICGEWLVYIAHTLTVTMYNIDIYTYMYIYI